MLQRAYFAGGPSRPTRRLRAAPALVIRPSEPRPRPSPTLRPGHPATATRRASRPPTKGWPRDRRAHAEPTTLPSGAYADRPPEPPRPRRRLRRAVCPADRPAGPRGAGLQRDRAAHDAGRRHARPQAGRDHPVRRPEPRSTPTAPRPRPGLLEAGVPVFGICYGFQAMARALGGTVARTGAREYGKTEARSPRESTLFSGQPTSQVVWMSHGDSVTEAPRARPSPRPRRHPRRRHRGRRATAPACSGTPRCCTPSRASGCSRTSSGRAPGSPRLDHVQRRRRPRHGDPRPGRRGPGPLRALRRRRLVVAAALVQKAVGDQLTCVFVDHGLLREGEAEQVEKDFVDATGVDLVVVDARERFLDALAGVTDPEAKRKVDRRAVHPGVRAGRARRRA